MYYFIKEESCKIYWATHKAIQGQFLTNGNVCFFVIEKLLNQISEFSLFISLNINFIRSSICNYLLSNFVLEIIENLKNFYDIIKNK